MATNNNNPLQEDFFRSFMVFVQDQLPALIEQNQRLIQNQSTPDNVSAPRTRTNQEFIMESLSNAITEFSYDVETNNTFENWYNRYADLFTVDARNLDDAAKIRLLLRKLDTSAHSKYVNLILPKKPHDFSFDATLIELKKIFGKHESIFNIRFKCLQTAKTEDLDVFTYGGLVNKVCEDFKLAELSIDQFKCLIFVMGLKNQSNLDIRLKLLSKLDSDHSTITLNKLISEYERLINVKKDSSLIQNKTESNTSILVNKITNKTNKPFKSHNPNKPFDCGSCGKVHKHGECFNKDSVCGYCSFKGHSIEFCRRKKSNSQKNNNQKSNGDKNKNAKATSSNKSPSKPSTTQSNSSNVSSVFIHQVSTNSRRKFIDIKINNQPITLQVDSAADISIISRDFCNKMNIKFSPTNLQPNCASGNTVNLIGEFNCVVTFNNNSFSSTFYVVDNENLNVFGNDLLEMFDLWDKPINDFCSKIQIHQVLQQNDYISFLQSNYASCFKKSLGKCKHYKAHLNLKENIQPPFCKFRPPPFAYQSLIEHELKRLQDIGVISPVSTSNVAAPIVAKQKKTGEIRICGDFSTGLNEALEDHKYPLPLPEDIFAKINGSTIFSHIDLSDAFLQVEMDDASKKLLIINTHIGLFQYERLSFGIKTAPTIFQELMDMLISPLENVICYLDDIFIFGRTKKIHDKALIALMNRIQDFGLHIKLEKSKFALNEIKYLGSIVNKYGLKPDPTRVEAINRMPPPSNLTELRSFLGTINFYGKFIRDMHKLRAPLDQLLQKNVEWNWSITHQDAFVELKNSLTSELLLTHYNPDLSIIVSADASNKGIGACIQDQMSDNSIKPLAYASRTLLKAEQNYSQIEKEGLALIFAVKKFHKFIFGRRFILQTDHKPLLAIFGSKKGIPVFTANRLQRWAVILLSYNFNIRFINTESFSYVDFLSRLINNESKLDQEFIVASIKLEKQIFEVVKSNLNTIPVTYKQISKTYSSDFSMQNLIKFISTDWKKFSATTDEAFLPFYRRRDSLSISGNIVLFGDRVVIPASLKNRIISHLHNGHPGIVRMKSIARSYVYWPSIDNDIEHFVKTCSPCALAGKSPVKTKLHSWPLSSNPWERVHIDYAGPFKKFHFLIIVDSFSKWPEIIKTSTTTTAKTISILSSVFARFGAPKLLVSDNGPQFTSEKFQAFCNLNCIEHIFTSPYHPMSNGQAERFVDTFKRSIKKMENDGDIDENLDVFLKSYRSTPNSNCPNESSPAEIMFNRKIRSIFDCLKPPKKTIIKRNVNMENQFNSKMGAKAREFNVGDPVYVQVHSNNTWRWEEAVINEKIGNVNFMVETEDRLIHSHTNQLKPRYTSSTQSSSNIPFNVLLDLFESENQNYSDTFNAECNVGYL